MTPTHITEKGTNTLGGQAVTPTPIDIDKLEGELVGHPCKAFVTNLITGLREGFFTGISEPPMASLVCPNNLSAKAQPKIVSQLIIKEKKKGFLVGPFRTPPFSLYRVSHLG